MHVKKLVPRVKGVVVMAGGFIRRHKRASIAVAVALLLFAPLLTTDGELVVLNAVGLGFGALDPRGPRAGCGRDGRNRHSGNGRHEQQHRTKGDTMTTQATTIGGTGTRPRRSLEEMVDQLMAAMGFKEQEPETVEPSAARSIHEARRLRQAGDVDGALAVLAGVDAAKAERHKARWAYAEWTDLVKRRSGDGNILVYSQGDGKAAALAPTDDGGTLEVVAVLGMCSRPGKVLSGRSLRGLKPLGREARHGRS